MKFYLTIIFLFVALSLSGCLESSFELADESRLPKWFYLPENMSRSDVKVTLAYYGPLVSGKGKAVFWLQRSDGRTLKKIEGITGDHPLLLKNQREGFPPGRPLYEVITIDGITDIVEHRKMEPVFYMADDPEVWQELITSQQ